MPQELFVVLFRYIGIFVLVVAIALIIARWKFPVTDDGGWRLGAQVREVWKRLRERRVVDREKAERLEAVRGRTALVIDPDEKSARVMTWKLKSLGCTVIRAKNATQGIRRAQEDGLGFIIADALLPGVSAAELYGSLSKAGVPVVFVGVLHNQRGELRCLGPNVACLGKPFDPEDAAALAGGMLRDGEQG